MVAPKAETVFTWGRERPIGIVLHCPTCDERGGIFAFPLRVETPNDWPPGECPQEVGQAGPLGFVARCDRCGFRVHLRGDRLPTVAMLRKADSGAPLRYHGVPIGPDS